MGRFIRDRPISPGSPWKNRVAERLIGTLRCECLDQLVLFEEVHLRRVRSAKPGAGAFDCCAAANWYTSSARATLDGSSRNAILCRPAPCNLKCVGQFENIHANVPHQHLVSRCQPQN